MNVSPFSALKNSTLLRKQAWINGQWCDAVDGKTFAVENPANQQWIGDVPLMGATETKTAISAAHQAFLHWRETTAKQRATMLLKWCDLILENLLDLSFLMATEQGKPLSEAKAEILYACSFIEWFEEEAKRMYGNIIPTTKANQRTLVLKQPVGVCAAITPWNFPMAMITRKVAPALAAGCTMILKPAESTPFSALALAVLAEQAGLPNGVLNVLTGDPKKIGLELTSNPMVRKLSFTGSTQTGRILMAQCAPTIKKLSLELGGNAPFIVFDDADLTLAVQGALQSKFRNAGQVCVGSNRFYVHRKIVDSFVKALLQAMEQLKVAPASDVDAQIGPLINQAAIEKIEVLLEDAVSKGANILLGGKRHPLGGYFFKPTLLTHVDHTMRLMQEEIFGPVLPIMVFDDDQEVVQMANDTEYGLAAYFFSQNLKRIWRCAEALDYGMIGVNTGLISTASAPFGGVKQSGLGREGSFYGIDEFIELKYLCLDLS